MLGIKRLAKTLASPFRVEAADTFQTVAHRGDPKGYQRVEVRNSHGRKRDPV
jgi:hypothetical protein